MAYAIRHVTRYRYSAPIVESHMEVRMQPRSEGHQRCWDFRLRTSPRARIESYRDPLGNAVHFFDVPGRHSRLTITAEANVEFTPMLEVPDRLDSGEEAWQELESLARDGDHWEYLAPSQFAPRSTPLLDAFRRDLDLAREDDPLATLRHLNHELYATFDYAPKSTRVDSPIDEALEARKGVCQDFSHIMIALVRGLGIPCRYVSGYLYPGDQSADRSVRSATHAWVEAYLPSLGWVGFDPTNDLVAADRHIRVAVGRDYADVPPTRGVFTGDATGEIAVDVKVVPSEATLLDDAPSSNVWLPVDADEQVGLLEASQEQQQQQ
jgi:transglutaminase-like putative cysteine protease